jgi:uncharacterized protein YbbK (DUF523 family)/uncharacterized protein YbgA (DUF1722 family)
VGLARLRYGVVVEGNQEEGSRVIEANARQRGAAGGNARDRARPARLDKVRIGISACLLGDEVRYDGGHKLDVFLADVLGPHVEWVRVCPEVELGMGTPREPVRLVRTSRQLHMITVRTGVDYTASMNAWARERLDALARERLSGYVLKKDSPSCGPDGVKVFGSTGAARRTGRGLFAEALIRRFPNLPVADEGRLADPALRENFMERVFAHARLRSMFDGPWTVDTLAAFHAAHELALLAHSPSAGARLRRLIATDRMPAAVLRERYERLFTQAFSVVPNPRRHACVLERLAASLARVVGQDASRELKARIAAYRRGKLPLSVPLTLIRAHVRRGGLDELEGQTYLQLHPSELFTLSESAKRLGR